MRSRKMQQALGQSVIAQLSFLLPEARVRFSGQLQESTYQAIGAIYWNIRMGRPIIFSPAVIEDIAAHAIFDRSAFLVECAKQPQADSALAERNALTAILTNTFRSLGNLADIGYFMTNFLQPNIPTQSKRGFIFPFLILTGVYRYLSDDIADKASYAAMNQLISTNPADMPADLFVVLVMNILPLLKKCTDDLTALDARFFMLENQSMATNNIPNYRQGATSGAGTAGQNATSGSDYYSPPGLK